MCAAYCGMACLFRHHLLNDALEQTAGARSPRLLTATVGRHCKVGGHYSSCADGWEGTMSLAMTKREREAFLADLHVGIISIPEEGRGPLTVPIWYSYEPGGELRVVTARTSRKAQLLQHAGRFSVCVQTETPPYKYVSRTHGENRATSGTWLFACCRNDGSRSTTQRHRHRHDRPSNRPLQQSGARAARPGR
jgi:hypothetical protein